MSNSRSSSRRAKIVLAAAAGLVCSLHGALAEGQTFYTWTYANNTGTWSTPSNWTPNGVPTSSDNAFFPNNASVVLAANESISSLDVGSSMYSTITLNLGTSTLSPYFFSLLGQVSLNGSGTLATGFDEEIGNGSSGTLTQNGGTNTAVKLEIDGQPGAYVLNAGTLNVPTEYVGFTGFGTASITQTGGFHSVSNDLSIGTTNSGIYTMSGGILNAANVYVGGDPNNFGGAPLGTFTIQTGAAATISQTLKVYPNTTSDLALNGGRLTVGTLNLSGSASRLTWNSGTLVIDGTTMSADGTLSVPKTGTLSGIGTINRPLTVTGTFAPGDPALTTTGSLTLTSSLALQSGSKLSFGIGDTPATNDELFIGSGFTAGPISLTGVSLSLTPLPNVVLGQSYVIVNAANDAMANPFVGTFASLTSTTPAAYTVNYDETDQIISVEFTALPEPASFVFLPTVFFLGARRRGRPAIASTY